MKLATSYREQLATEKRSAYVRLVGAVAAAIGGHWLLYTFNGPLRLGSFCLTFCSAGVVLYAVMVPRRKPRALHAVFDRRVIRPSTLEPHVQHLHRLALMIAVEELEVLTREPGVAPLSHFVHIEGMGEGIACHEPSQGLATLDALLAALPQARPPLRDAAAVREGLEDLRADLQAADACGARFCLMPVAAWTGLAESNLGLFLGTWHS
ncbi:hypothetical protein [Pyxidicoccus trucidator]|uniref:hypothetical protein n=1 Tax=Pyxidicoccus trucidator TaxID=2709662 RepID=UPI0013D94065|nr:hypothetical protein [Pyxidicoccus trucidator]